MHCLFQCITYLCSPHCLLSSFAFCSKTWWTVEAKAPEPPGVVDTNTERALRILLQIIGMHLHEAWKSLQLGVLTLWNACARNPNMERHIVERGAAIKLLLITNNRECPTSRTSITPAPVCIHIYAVCTLSYYISHTLIPYTTWPLPFPFLPSLIAASVR